MCIKNEILWIMWITYVHILIITSIYHVDKIVENNLT